MGQGIPLMGINLLEELDTLALADNQAGRFKVAFFLTYTINLQFFEQLILPKLERLGVSYIGILSDWRTYQDTLSTPLRQEKCGRRYVLGYSPWLRTLQHGKLLWLHGDTDIVYVGSHNLTRAGYNDQLELTVRLSSSEPDQVSAVSAAYNVVSKLVGKATSLSQLWNRVSKPEVNNEKSVIHFLWSGDEGLLGQIYSITGRTDNIRVVTPYLDASALSELCDLFSPKSVILDLPFEGADTPLVDATNAVPNIKPRTVILPYRLHGKAYEFTGNNKLWVTVGSANCTQAGLIKSVSEGGNSEFLVLVPADLHDEEHIKFELVENVADYPGTGRRWDEGSPYHKDGITHLSAVYDNRELSITWECDGELLDARLISGDSEHKLEGSPAKLYLEDKPQQLVTLSGQLHSEEVSAMTWVMFADELAFHASSVFINRRNSYLESRDPMQQAQGIDYELLQLFQLIRMSLSSTSQSEEVHKTSTWHELKRETVEEVVNIFEFSPDHDEITRHASRIIVGNDATDPLALIRGLVAKIGGPIPREYMENEESIGDYTSRQTRAKRRIGDMLFNHLHRLRVIAEDHWGTITRERVKICLQGTLECATLLWWKVMRREQKYTDMFAEEILEFLESIMSIEVCRNICNDIEVCGPLILTIGAAANSTSEEYERESLRKYLRQVSKDYKKLVMEWSNHFPERANLIVKIEKDVNLDIAIQSRIKPVDHLMGIADQQLLQKQETKWGLLLELVEAIKNGSPVVGPLLQEAESQFKDHPVWLRCKSYLDTHKVPLITRVDKYICTNCYLSLPIAFIHELEKGEAVVCPNCKSILMFGKIS